MLEIAVLACFKEQPPTLRGRSASARPRLPLGRVVRLLYPAPSPRAAGRDRWWPSRSLPAERGNRLARANCRATAARAAPKPSRRTRSVPDHPCRRRAFEELLLADDPHTDEDKAFALKLAFCSELPAPARIELLERRHVALLTRLNQSRRATATRNDRYSRSLVEHRTRSVQRDLEWVEELLEAERATEVPDQPGTPDLPDVKEGVS